MQELITRLKTLSRPTEQQKLLIALAENEARSPADEKKLKLLVAAELAAEKAAKARAKATKLIKAESDKKQAEERKARNHRLIQQGLLFDLAGLETVDRAELLGLLVTSKSLPADSEKRAEWKRVGAELMAEKGAK